MISFIQSLLSPHLLIRNKCRWLRQQVARDGYSALSRRLQGPAQAPEAASGTPVDSQCAISYHEVRQAPNREQVANLPMNISEHSPEHTALVIQV